mgnify:FL=1
MKKVFALLLAAVLLVLAGCSTQPAEPKTAAIDIASLKGPTTMGLVHLMDKAEKGETKNQYNVTVYGTADEFVGAFTKGEIPVANVPTNVASVLYNRTEGKIGIIGVNTLGVLYMIADQPIASIADLRGKTIYTTGKGTTPEYVLNYVLTKNGLDPAADVTVEYLSEATEVASKLSAGVENAVGMLPQPYVTVVTTQNPAYSIVLDMNAEWEKVSGGTPIVTGVVAVNLEFYNANKEAFALFLADYAESAKFANENPEEAADLIEKYGIIKAAVAKKAIPYCNITLLTGDEMQQAVSAYLGVLAEANPTAVGGKLPNEDFYIK